VSNKEKNKPDHPQPNHPPHPPHPPKPDDDKPKPDKGRTYG